MNKKLVGLVAGAVALTGVGVGVGLAVTSGGCQADPSAVIAALPAGGTFHGQGCYQVNDGLVLTKSVTINGGTYQDDSTGPTKVPGQQLGVKPVIQVKSADSVTLENLSVVGGQTGGPRFNASLVAQSGISLKSATNTKILNVTTDRTFGDGLLIFQDGPRSPVTSNLFVSGLTISNHGRFGISPSAVYGAVLNNVTINPQPNGASIDAESDVPGLGMGNVAFNDLKAGNGIYIRETLNGAVDFLNASMTGAVTMQNLNSTQSFPVTFTGGSLAIGLGRTIGVQIKGGVAVFNGTTFTRQPTTSGKPQKNPMWYANTGASLTFAHCLLSPPLGTNDATSTVAVTP